MSRDPYDSDNSDEVGPRGRGSMGRESSPIRRAPLTVDSEDEDNAAASSSTSESSSTAAKAPLLRQPLVSSWGNKTVLPSTATYPVQPATCRKHFLPGQTVVDAPQITRDIQEETHPKRSTRRQKRNQHFSEQTGSWKVAGYTNGPNIPIEQPRNTGPYNSAFRATDPPSLPSYTLPPLLLPHSDDDVSSSALPYSHPHYPTSTAGPSAPLSNIFPEPAVATPPFLTSPSTDREIHRQVYRTSATLEPTVYGGAESRALYEPHQSTQSQLTARPDAGWLPEGHHVLDREASNRQRVSPDNVSSEPYVGHHKELISSPPGGISPTYAHLTPDKSASRQMSRKEQRSSQPARTHASQPPEQQTLPLRLLAVLIEDRRWGDPDPQLAEFKVPLKPSGDSGFWADAKDVCDKLQNSPSRIDGPAKVYNFRGKYRHCFLRISKDNFDNYISTNLQVSSERTLEIVVDWDIPPNARSVGGTPTAPEIHAPRPQTPATSSVAATFTGQLLTPEPTENSEGSCSTGPCIALSIKRKASPVPASSSPWLNGLAPPSTSGTQRSPFRTPERLEPIWSVWPSHEQCDTPPGAAKSPPSHPNKKRRCAADIADSSGDDNDVEAADRSSRMSAGSQTPKTGQQSLKYHLQGTSERDSESESEFSE